MGPDAGVQRALKVGSGSVGLCYGFAGAMWWRNGTFYAHARVFVRGSTPQIKGMVETIKVEAPDGDRVLLLLHDRIQESFGDIRWVQWFDPHNKADASPPAGELP